MTVSGISEVKRSGAVEWIPQREDLPALWGHRSEGSQRSGISSCLFSWTSLVVQPVKSLPAMLETWVRSLGEEYPLVKGMATHSSVLAWRFLWT